MHLRKFLLLEQVTSQVAGEREFLSAPAGRLEPADSEVGAAARRVLARELG